MMWIFLLFPILIWSEAGAYNDGAVELSYSCVNHVTTGTDLPPILLMHGLTENRSSWRGIYEVLALQTNRRVCMSDARNHGLSPRTKEFSYDLMAADTVRLLDNLNVTRALLIGHSMGGRTAMVTALKHPDRVEKIVVEDMRLNSVDPGALSRMNFTFQILRRSLESAPEGASDQEAREAIMSYIRKAMKETFGEPMDEEEDQRLNSMLLCESGKCRYPVDMDFVIRVLLDPEINKVYDGRYDGDSLFVYGQVSDFKVGEAKDEILGLFPKAQLVPIEGAGHVVHVDKSRDFLSAVIRFINADKTENSTE